jgi:thioredoxin reductase (NADPH)
MSEIRHTDIAILGGGPAGLTAAIYGARTNRKTLVIERMQFGGQLSGTDAVENFPGFKEEISGFDLSENMRAQAERFGTEFLFTEAKSIELRDDQKTKVIHTGEGEVHAKALIVATGSRPRKLDIPGEDKWWGKGISTCATCDGAFFKEKEVIVIGGGDAAVEEGSFLTNFASKVTIVHRRDELRATPILQKRAMNNPKIEFVWDTVATEYIGEDKLEGIKTKNVKTGEEGELHAPGVFIFIGHIPNTDIVKDLLPLNDHGLIKAKYNTKTDIPGLYAAGDLRTESYMQAVTAAADGCMAAINAEHYIAALEDED